MPLSSWPNFQSCCCVFVKWILTWLLTRETVVVSQNLLLFNNHGFEFKLLEQVRSGWNVKCYFSLLAWGLVSSKLLAEIFVPFTMWDGFDLFAFVFGLFFFTLWLGIEIKCPRNRPNTRKKWWGISSFLPACLFYFCHFILYFIHYILFLLVISTRVIIYSGLPKVAKKWTIKERDMNFFFSHVQSKFWIIHLNFPLFAKNGKLVGKKAKLSYYIIFHWNTEIDNKTVTVVVKTQKKTKQKKKHLNFLVSISDLTMFNVNSGSLLEFSLIKKVKRDWFRSFPV